MLFKQILLAGALQVALITAIDADVHRTPGSRVDRFEEAHPEGNRTNRTHDDNHDHANVDVNHQHQNGTTWVSGNVQKGGDNVGIDVQPSPGSRTDRFLKEHPKGNRTHNRDHDRNHVNVDVNHQHHNGPTTVSGNVQTRGNNINIDVQPKEGSRTDKFLKDHPKGNRTHEDGAESDDEDDEDHVNVDHQHQNGTTTVGGTIQTRDEDNIDVDVQTKEGSRTDKFLKDHPKGNRTHEDGADSDDEDDENHVDADHQRQDGTTTVGGSIQTRDEDNVDVDVTPKPNSRLDKWMKEHPAGNRTHNDHDIKVDVDHKTQEGKTTVGGNIQARGLGNAIIANRCEQDIWIWSVDESASSAPIKVAGRSRYTEPFRTPGAGGVVFKVSNSDQIVGGAHTQFEYAISNDQIYYDISFVDCAKGESASDCPGHAKGLSIYSTNDACAKAYCAPGSYCPEQAYYVDTPLSKLGLAEPVFGCGSAGTGMDLYMVTCTENPQVLKRSIAGRLSVEF